MTKIQTVKISSENEGSSENAPSLGFAALLSDAVPASESAAKLTLQGASYTQCDIPSAYI